MRVKVLVQEPQEDPHKGRFDNRCRSGLHHFHKTMTILETVILKVLYRLPTPYRLQQGPLGQLPQNLFPLPAPHVPSVVLGPVGGAATGLPNTGSWVSDAGIVVVVVGSLDSVQPFWHPLETRQL